MEKSQLVLMAESIYDKCKKEIAFQMKKEVSLLGFLRDICIV